MNLRTGLTTAVLSLAALAGGQAYAADAYAYVHRSIPANSDVLVSAPVNTAIEAELTVTNKAGSVLSFVNSPSFSSGDFNAGTFAKYYVRITSGPAEGLWASIAVNGETTITITNPLVAALVTNGSNFRVYKHQTVGSMFPAALTGQSFVDGTQLLFFSDADAQFKNPGSGGIVNYTTYFDLGWGNNAERPILPEEAFIIRNNSASALTYVAVGFAPDHAVAYLVKPGVARDTALGTGYPVAVTVQETGLGAFNGRQIRLQGTSKNAFPGSLATYTFSGSWGANAGVELQPNSAFILRQTASDTGGKATVVKPY
ncbi:MAG: TIGR02597 family protein [Phycisphaeraceae bacterium]